MDNNHPYPMPLSKREQFIIAAMQELLANPHSFTELLESQIAARSIEMADRTLAMAEKTAKKPEPIANLHTMD